RRRAIDIAARAEADDADAFAGRERLAFIDAADDASGNQPGDQHAGDRRSRLWRDTQCQPFVVEARLVEAGINEAAFGVMPRGELAADGRAGDMDIEEVQEDADPRQRR